MRIPQRPWKYFVLDKTSYTNIAQSLDGNYDSFNAYTWRYCLNSHGDTGVFFLVESPISQLISAVTTNLSVFVFNDNTIPRRLRRNEFISDNLSIRCQSASQKQSPQFLLHFRGYYQTSTERPFVFLADPSALAQYQTPSFHFPYLTTVPQWQREKCMRLRQPGLFLNISMAIITVSAS